MCAHPNTFATSSASRPFYVSQAVPRPDGGFQVPLLEHGGTARWNFSVITKSSGADDALKVAGSLARYLNDAVEPLLEEILSGKTARQCAALED